MIDLSHATPEELAELERLSASLAAAEDPLDFTELLSPQTQKYPHMRLISDHLRALVEYRLYPSGPGPEAEWFYLDRDTRSWQPALSRTSIPSDAVEVEGRHPTLESETVSQRLGIVLPPRHGKSWITTQHFPIWISALRPGVKVAVYTYSDDMGHEWGADVRDRIVEAEAKLGLAVTGGSSSARALLTLTNGSTIRFGGVGGRLTGRGWDVGIIDDPFKGAEDAYSAAERKVKRNWYGAVWSNRRESIWAVEVMMFTRWHEDDLAGEYIYDDMGNVRKEWCLLHLPALCVDPDNDPLGRVEDEALCPERFNEQYLYDQRTEHPDKFQALYQGDPSMDDGGILPKPYPRYTRTRFSGKTENLICRHLDGSYEHINVRHLRVFGVCDIAATTKSRSDWTVFTLWGMAPDRKTFLLDLARFRSETPDIAAQLLDWFLSRRPVPVEVCIEKSGAGLPVVQSLQRQGRLSIRALEPKDYGGDKVARAYPLGQALQSREMWIPREADWLPKLEIEMKAFPNSRYDDQVDCMGYAQQLRFEYPVWSVERDENLTIEEQIERSILEKERRASAGGRSEDMLSPSRIV